MPEYIEREALIKRIRILPRFAPYNTVSYSSVQNAIFDAPTADVVEVVRCKDCEKWDTSNKLLRSCACSRWSQSMPYPRLTDPDDFCSYGERKEGDEE